MFKMVTFHFWRTKVLINMIDLWVVLRKLDKLGTNCLHSIKFIISMSLLWWYLKLPGEKCAREQHVTFLRSGRPYVTTKSQCRYTRLCHLRTRLSDCGVILTNHHSQRQCPWCQTHRVWRQMRCRRIWFSHGFCFIVQMTEWCIHDVDRFGECSSLMWAAIQNGPSARVGQQRRDTETPFISAIMTNKANKAHYSIHTG